MKWLHSRGRAVPPRLVDLVPLIIVAALLLACAMQTQQAQSPDGDRPKLVGEIPLEELMQNPRQVMDVVSQTRGLSEKQQTPVLFQEMGAFEKMLAQGNHSEGVPETALNNVHVALAFSNLSPLDLGEHDYEKDTGISGYYDRDTKTIVMLKPEPPVEKEEKKDAKEGDDEDSDEGDRTAWVLAHETGHALQDQHFPRPDFKLMKTDDQRLAASAVFEGDAMVAMLGYLGKKGHIPLRRILINEERGAKEEADANYRKATGSTADFEKAPLMYRERTISPYRDGLRFMSSIYRTGGFELSNQVFSALPTTMEQVLHPEKYLQGEQAVTIEAPPVPEGFEQEASGTLGELLTRAVLDQCLPAGSAGKVASGWGGDAFSLGKNRDMFALTWATHWDTEEDAKEFEEGALRLFRCWRRRDREAKEDKMFEGEQGVLRAGKKVALAYGVEKELLDGLLEGMLAQEHIVQAAAPPLGDVQFAALPDLPESRPPYIQQGRFVNERVGVEVPIPTGFITETEGDGVFIHDQDKRIGLWFIVSEQEVTEASMKENFEGFRNEWPHKDVKETGQLKTPLGVGHHRGWGRQVMGTAPRELTPDSSTSFSKNHVQMTLIPICNKQGAIVLAAVMNDDWARDQAAKWWSQIKQTSTQTLPICAELNP